MSDSDVKPTHDLISVNVNEKTHKKQLFLTGNMSVCVSLSVSRKRLQTLTISLCSGMLQCSAAPPAGGLWMTVAGEPQSSQAGPTRGVWQWHSPAETAAAGAGGGGGVPVLSASLPPPLSLHSAAAGDSLNSSGCIYSQISTCWKTCQTWVYLCQSRCVSGGGRPSTPLLWAVCPAVAPCQENWSTAAPNRSPESPESPD